MVETADKQARGPVIRLHPNDNVLVARTDVGLGQSIPGENVVSRAQVAAGYKIAARHNPKGEPVLKYNVVVGFAARDIAPGSVVHSHNTELREFDRDHAHATEYRPVALLPRSEQASFEGIVRADGRVATRELTAINGCRSAPSHDVSGD
jgi:altronate hydrolase